MPTTKAPSTLPAAAQEMWIKVFNNAWSNGCNESDECSARVAWKAIKGKYKKDGDMWVALEDEPTASTPLLDKYVGVGRHLLSIVRTIYPNIPQRVKIELMESDEEFEQTYNRPTGSAKFTYASAIGSDLVVFTQEHQKQMENYTGVFTAGNANEVGAIKTMVHEIIHLASPQEEHRDRSISDISSPPRDQTITVETTAELMACFVTASLPAEGDGLVKTVADQILYKDLFPWVVFVFLAALGSPEEAFDMISKLVTMPTGKALDLLSNTLAQMLKWRVIDVSYFLQRPESRFTEWQRGQMDEMKHVVDDMTEGQEPLEWFIAHGKEYLIGSDN